MLLLRVVKLLKCQWVFAPSQDNLSARFQTSNERFDPQPRRSSFTHTRYNTHTHTHTHTTTGHKHRHTGTQPWTQPWTQRTGFCALWSHWYDSRQRESRGESCTYPLLLLLFVFSPWDEQFHLKQWITKLEQDNLRKVLHSPPPRCPHTYLIFNIQSNAALE